MGNYFFLPDYCPEDAEFDTDLVLDPSAYYNYGNYWDVTKRIPLLEIARMSQKEQMKFSDAIVRRYARNATFLSQQRIQLQSIDWSSFAIAGMLNETSIGNAAFVAHWNPEDSFWQEHYKAIVDSILLHATNNSE